MYGLRPTGLGKQRFLSLELTVGNNEGTTFFTESTLPLFISLIKSVSHFLERTVGTKVTTIKLFLRLPYEDIPIRPRPVETPGSYGDKNDQDSNMKRYPVI